MKDKKYTYSDELYSDLFKDVYGFRPTGMIYEGWLAKSKDDKQLTWDMLVNDLQIETWYEEKEQSWEETERNWA